MAVWTLKHSTHSTREALSVLQEHKTLKSGDLVALESRPDTLCNSALLSMTRQGCLLFPRKFPYCRPKFTSNAIPAGSSRSSRQGRFAFSPVAPSPHFVSFNVVFGACGASCAHIQDMTTMLKNCRCHLWTLCSVPWWRSYPAAHLVRPGPDQNMEPVRNIRYIKTTQAMTR